VKDAIPNRVTCVIRQDILMLLLQTVPYIVELVFKNLADRIEIIGYDIVAGRPYAHGFSTLVSFGKPCPISRGVLFLQRFPESRGPRGDLSGVVLVRSQGFSVAFVATMFGNVPECPPEIEQLRSAPRDPCPLLAGGFFIGELHHQSRRSCPRHKRIDPEKCFSRFPVRDLRHQSEPD